MKKIIILTLTLLLLLSLTACSKEETITKTIQSPQKEIAPNPFEGAPLNIIAINAYKFQFSPNIINATAGDHVRLTITSTDVGHGFAMPDYGINKKIPAQESVTIDFLADKTGEFNFFSSVYSGKGYEDMTGTFIVRE